jgi:hypothetical protein
MVAGGIPTAGQDSPRGHAGLESDGFTLVAYDTPDQLRGLLVEIGVKMDAVGRLLDDQGRGIKCCSCEKDVSVEEVGHVLPGSTYIYCKDPVCVLDYLERFA